MTSLALTVRALYVLAPGVGSCGGDLREQLRKKRNAKPDRRTRHGVERRGVLIPGIPVAIDERVGFVPVFGRKHIFKELCHGAIAPPRSIMTT